MDIFSSIQNYYYTKKAQVIFIWHTVLFFKLDHHDILDIFDFFTVSAKTIPQTLAAK